MTERYLQIVAAVDAEFSRNRELHGDRIHCRPGCTDCCYHVFPIGRIEAARISEGLEQMESRTRRALEEKAEEYIRERLLRGTRLPCPALADGVCSIYEFRPLMCHKFGMPLYNPDKPGQIFACDLNFADGEEIRDPQLIPIQTDIHREWKELQVEYDAAQPGEADSPLTVAHAILRALSRRSGSGSAGMK
jgi:Fe-S-cluster containining protein